MSEIPSAPIDRVIRKAGAYRVSEKAAKELAMVLEEIGISISKKAIILAEHAKRKTVTEKDIKLAVKELEIIK